MQIEEHAPYKHPYLDCAGMALYSVLRFHNYKMLDSAWKQSGMVYQKDKDYPFGSLSGEYMWVTEELEWIHNIKVTHVIESNNEKFVESLRAHLIGNIPIIIFANVGELPYSPYYASINEQHCFVALGIEDEEVIICDDYYKFKGKEKLAQIVRASTSVVNYKDGSQQLKNAHYVVAPAGYHYPKPLDMLEAISLNEKVLRGDYESEKVIHSKGLGPNTHVEVGLDTIDLFLRDVNEFLESGVTIEEHHLDSLRDNLSYVSNSRYLYSDVLAFVGSELSVFQELSHLYREIAQGWKVASNMVLKASAGNERELLYRMLNRIRDNKSKEYDALERTADGLKQLSF